jgi:hypothetical protein
MKTLILFGALPRLPMQRKKYRMVEQPGAPLKRRILRSGLWLSLLCALPTLYAQIAVSSGSSPAIFVTSSALPSPVRFYLHSFGDRIQKAGNERTVLVGTYSDPSGNTQGQLTWQAPGSVRFDRSNQPGKALIYNSTSGVLVGASISPQDANIFESLLDDPAESFLYGFQSGTSYRLIGQRFRADDGKAANYKGPWYDVYAANGIGKAQPNKPTFVKHYYIDSVTGLLAKTQYLSSGILVTTEFNSWTNVNGQSFPGQIVRKEGGTVVFTFGIVNATTSAGQNDATFSHP